MPPRPRRFRFSLRLLFLVVTVVCAVLSWQLKLAHQRRAFLARNEVTDYSDAQAKPTTRPMAPGLLWLVGERGVSRLVVVAPQYEEARRLFPEADVTRGVVFFVPVMR